MHSPFTSRLRQARQEDGFTLIELMIAVLILGNLAMIALPVLNRQRERAKDSAVQQRLEAGLRAAKSIYTDGESFPASGLGTMLSRSERSGSFVDGSSFAQGQVQVERPTPTRIILRSQSRTGANHMLALDEPASRVYRWAGDPNRANLATPAYNLVLNPSFENATLPWTTAGAGGSSWTTATNLRTTRWASSGNTSMEVVRGPAVVSNASGGMINSTVGAVIATNGAPVTAVPSIAVQAMVNLEQAVSTNGTMRLRVRFYDNALALCSQTDVQVVAATRPQIRKLSGTLAVPSCAAWALPEINLAAGAIGDTFTLLFDSVSVVASDQVEPYFDGDSPASAWTSTAHNSFSTGPGGTQPWGG